MTPQQERDLRDLRVAAKARDQQQLQFMVKRLLKGLDFYVALAVPLERMHQYLDIFESYYPDETWVRQLVLMIGTYGSKPDDSVAEMALQQSFDEAGAANFLKAVYDVTQAMNDQHTKEARVGFLASAVVNSIMAELVEAYYGDRPQLWRRVRTNDYDDPTVADIAYNFWMDETTRAMDIACWLEIAASIEAKLTRLSSS
jgi:hypothetical protein